MKKFFALLLAVILVCSFSITAFAAGGGSIIVSNAVAGEIYTAYKLFDLESYNAESGAYTYTIDTTSPWYAFFTGEGAGASYVDVDSEPYIGSAHIVTWKDDVDETAAADLAAAAIAYIKTVSNISPAGSATASEQGGTVTANITNLDLGYYLVDTSLGALCALNTTDPTAEVREKNSTPTVDKLVKEDSTDEWGKSNTADIAQTVEYKSTLNNVANVTNLVFHDTMTNLTFSGVSAIKLNDDSDVPAAAYTVTPTNGGNTFTVSFTDAYLAELKEEDFLVIYYSATLDDDAVIGGTAANENDPGNPNECYITYGNAQESTHDKVRTFTYEINVFKFTKNAAGSETPLAGVEFVLYKMVDGEENYAQVDANGKITGWTATKDGENGATKLTTDANGMIYIQGLDVDTYYLEETKELAGYNKLTGPVKIEIKADGTFSNDTHTVGDISYSVTKVENKTGTVLPETGGIGTTIFYVLGSVLVVGAAVLLITKKRMNAER